MRASGMSPSDYARRLSSRSRSSWAGPGCAPEVSQHRLPCTSSTTLLRWCGSGEAVGVHGSSRQANDASLRSRSHRRMKAVVVALVCALVVGGCASLNTLPTCDKMGLGFVKPDDQQVY